MKPVVNQNSCIGCGLCAQICPDLFVIQPNMIARVIGLASDEESITRLEAICEYCPVNSISLESADI